MPKTRSGDYEIYYETIGDEGDPVALLIAGASVQLVFWSDGFCSAIAEHGFRVVRMDNREFGMSSRTPGPPPDLVALSEAFQAGQIPSVPWTLSDMALDCVAVLDDYGVDRCVVLGHSLGSLVAARLASDHPDRVAGFVSLASEPGHVAPTPPMDRPGAQPDRVTRDRDTAIAEGLAITRAASGGWYDDEYYRQLWARAYDRGDNLLGYGFQLAACTTGGDGPPRLASIRVPSLVLHGRNDPWFPLARGEATAAAIPGAELVVIDGMGHLPDPPFWPEITSAIVGLAKRAFSTSTEQPA